MNPTLTKVIALSNRFNKLATSSEVLYHGSPFGGLASFRESKFSPIFLTPSKKTAFEYALNKMLDSGITSQKNPEIENPGPTIYTVRVTSKNVIDFREESTREKYMELRKKLKVGEYPEITSDEEWLSLYPPLHGEGFVSASTGLPSFSRGGLIVRLFKTAGIPVDAIWLDEGSQGISLAVFNSDSIEILEVEGV